MKIAIERWDVTYLGGAALERVRQTQKAFWDALRVLEQLTGEECSSTRDYDNAVLEDIRNGNYAG